jgi:hypothetical protein
VLRIALAASWRGGRVDRRRAALLAGAAAIVTVVLCGCASAWLLSTRVEDRASARGFVHAADGQPADLERAVFFDEALDGRQIYVYWWRVLDPSVSIPGVGSDPGAATGWWVTPELAARLRDDPSLADRFPSARVLAEEGVAHRAELMAYRFVGPEVPLSDRFVVGDDAEWIGDGAEAVDLYPIAVATLLLVGVPGLGLLTAAISPLAASLERRWLLLRALGAPARTRFAVVALQAALAAGPGAAAGGLVWWLGAPRLRAVPFVGKPVFGGDLALPLAWAIPAALVVTLVAVLVAAVRTRGADGPRPGDLTPRRPSFVRVLPLVGGIALTCVGAAVPGSLGARVFLAGVLASTVGSVVGLPYLLDRVGTRLAAGERVTTLLVGRRLRWSAVASARSLIAVGTLAALLPVVGAWVAVARDVDEVDRPASGAVVVNGELPAADVEVLAARTGSIPVELATQVLPDGQPRPLVVGDCEALRASIPIDRCGPEGFAVANDVFGGSGPPVLEGVAELPPGLSVDAVAFVTDDVPAVDAALRAHVLNGTRPNLNVQTPGHAVFHESPLVAWILGAAALAGVLGAVALTLHLAGQAARTARTRRRLLALGTDEAVLRRIAGTEAGLVVGLVGLGCGTVGAITSWLYVQADPTAAVPATVLALVLLGVLTASAVAGSAAALTAAPPDLLRPRR